MSGIAKGAGRLQYAPLLLAAAAVAIHFWPGLAPALEYDRAAVLDGEAWRLLTGHWTHFTFDHLFWDVAVFAGLGWLCASIDRRRFWAVTLGSALLISVLLLAFMPFVSVSRGLSGIDSALFVTLGIHFLRERAKDRQWGWVTLAGAVLLGFAGKVVFEMATGTTVFVDSAAAGMTPLPLAHVAGAAVGLAAGIGRQPFSLFRQHAPDPVV